MNTRHAHRTAGRFVSLAALLVGVALLLGACQPEMYFARYVDLPPEGWDADSAVLISLPESEEGIDLSLTVGVRTVPRFAYADVVARLELLDEDSLVISSTLLPVAVSEGAKPLGTGFPFVDHYSRPQPLRLPACRRYTLRLRHAMRLNPLEGVTAVGVMLEQ